MKKKYILIVVLALSFQACEKFIELPAPKDSLNQENVYTTDATAAAVVYSVYSRLSNDPMLSISSPYSFTTVYIGLSSDEMVYYAPNDNSRPAQYYRNAVSVSTPSLYDNAYVTMFVINDAIENLVKADLLTPSVRKHLLGEAYFLRAYYYYNLVNIYGDIPLVLGTNYEKNALVSRTPVKQVYLQIEDDLKKSKSLLEKKYVGADGKTETTERTVPNYYAATGLLARIYLYDQKYTEAAAEATEVIAQTTLYELPATDKVFLMNSKEALFQLQPVAIGWNTQDARFFKVVNGFNGNNPVYLSRFLMDAFMPGDLRREEWVGKWTDTKVTPNKDYYYASKYKIATLNAPISEYSTILRLAEQYLIRAEAKAYLSDNTGAIEDLNVIRARARAPISADVPNPLPDYSAGMTKAEILVAVMKERQVELFSEQGHRWFDLKRTGLLDSVMGSAELTGEKNSTWSSFRQLFPISTSDLLRNPNLTQTPGY